MTKTSMIRRVETFRRLSAPAEPLVWQRSCAGVHDSFFFAWGGAESHARRASRRLSPSGGMLDVAAILDEVKTTFRPTEAGDVDDLDDSMFCVSPTALFDRSRRESDPGRYVDPAMVPFLAISTRRTFRGTGVALGDHATVFNTRTGRVSHAIIGDAREVFGVEPSPFLAESLGLAAGDRAIYLIHPGTGRGQGTIPGVEEIHRRGESLYRTPGWSAILAEFLATSAARG